MLTLLLAATLPSITLRATWPGGEEAWRISVSGSETSCTQEVTRSKAPGKTVTQKLGEKDCAKIFELLKEIPEGGGETSARRETPDEPSYTFELDGRRLPVALRAPRVCEAKPSGELRCKDQTLSSAQELLIDLRARVRQ